MIRTIRTDRHKKKRKRSEKSGAMLRRAIVGIVITVIVCLAPFVVYQHVLAVGKGEDRTDHGGFSHDIEVDFEEITQKFKRKWLVSRIDSHLQGRGSPLTGLGEEFVKAQERTGVSAALLVGLLEAESGCATNGSLSQTNHNGFGMKGPQPALGISAQNGYCWWPDWTAAINGAADFVLHYWGPAQTGLDLSGYAARSGPGSPWLSRVEGGRTAIVGQ